MSLSFICCCNIHYLFVFELQRWVGLWQALFILLPTQMLPTCPKASSRSTDAIAHVGGHSVLDLVAVL